MVKRDADKWPRKAFYCKLKIRLRKIIFGPVQAFKLTKL
jgi:hypothetical protein